jgi:hypothetical protein
MKNMNAVSQTPENTMYSLDSGLLLEDDELRLIVWMTGIT